MAIWKDSNGALHDDMGGEAISLPNWPAGMTQLTDAQAAAVRAGTKAQQLTAALAALATAYAADMQQLNMGWLAAAVADGTGESTRKTAIGQSITDRKAQYAADVAAARAKYAT